MAVYVDDSRNRMGDLVMSHLLADSEEALARAAAFLNLRPEWRHGDHYDVCQATKARALNNGAIEITRRHAVRMRRQLKRGETIGRWP